MANITLLGASYTDVPAVDLPQTGGGTVRFYENGGTPSATQHTIYFEFSDETTTTVTAYYDSSFISDAIRATTPTTYDSKTVDSASLDGVEWYTRPTETYETYYDGSITTASDKTISISSLSDLYFASGETWRVTWDGTEYTCYPNVHEGWLWYIGNHGLTDGTDDGVSEPFCLYNYGGGALNGTARVGGTHTLKLEKQT